MLAEANERPMKVRIHYTRFHRSRLCSARVLSLTKRQKPRCKPEAPTSQPGTDRSRTPSQPSNACSTGRLPPSCESENRDSRIAVFQQIPTRVIHGSCTALTQERTGGPSCCTQDWAHAGPTRSHPSGPCKVLDPTPHFSIHTCDWCAHEAPSPGWPDP